MTVNISKPSINIREKLSELDKPSGIAGEAVLRADSVQEIRNSIGAGRKNLIINGGFDVWQRGTYTTATNVSSGFQSDRWKIAQSATTGTIQDLGGSVRLEVTGAGTGTLRMYQPIEDKGLYKRISGKTLTFSAWVKSNTANARIECFKGNGVGWDGWDSAHTGGGAWEKLSATYVLADISSLTDGAFSVQVGLDGYNSADVALAVGDYCEIKDVQLELGSVATDFEHRSFGEELQLCKRYYEKSFAYSAVPANGSSATTFATSPNVSLGVLLWSGPNARNIAYEVEKRVTPTVVRYGNSSGYWGYINAGGSPSGSDNTPIFHANIFCQTNTPKVLVVTNQASGNPLWSISGHWTAEAEL